MSELDQLKERINSSGPEGIENAIVREDYEPAGDMMLRNLLATNEFIARKGHGRGLDQKWRMKWYGALLNQ